MWNLDSAAMERMLAIEQAGAQFIVDNDSTAFSVLAEVKEAMDLAMSMKQAFVKEKQRHVKDGTL